MKKYGRTYHLPISPGATSDDKVLRDPSVLSSAEDVVFMEKTGGENVTIHAGTDIAQPQRQVQTRDGRDVKSIFLAPEARARRIE